MKKHTPFLEEIFVRQMMDQNPTIPEEAFPQLVKEEIEDTRENGIGNDGVKSNREIEYDPELDLKIEEQEAE